VLLAWGEIPGKNGRSIHRFGIGCTASLAVVPADRQRLLMNIKHFYVL
jgi:hypothetical protein